jgi:hypothetical protein
LRRCVSIHAPAWGATSVDLQCSSPTLCFNPRPRVGGDRADRPHAVGPGVSIHAPAWGATAFLDPVIKQVKVSIHAPAWGATSRNALTLSLMVFQSTPPRGGRPRACGRIDIVTVFQSTPPRGGRPSRRSRGDRRSWFQSTPPRGGRPSPSNYLESKSRNASQREGIDPGITYQRRAKANSLYLMQPT